MNALETMMFEVGALFLAPVLFLILLLFAWSFVASGAFLWEMLQRKRQTFPGDLSRWVSSQTPIDSEQLELRISEKLERYRIISRTAPMLGLVATMIPLGPALLALGDGDLATVGERLVVAFAAVILALITASIAYAILTIRRRWLLQELKTIEERHA